MSLFKRKEFDEFSPSYGVPSIWKDPTMWSLILSVVALFGLVIWILTGKRFNSNVAKDKDNMESGWFEVRTVDAHDEKHEYLLWHDAYKGGLTHLPNCKFCKEANDGE